MGKLLFRLKIYILYARQGGRITVEFSEGGTYQVGTEGRGRRPVAKRVHRGASTAAGGSSCGSVRRSLLPSSHCRSHRIPQHPPSQRVIFCGLGGGAHVTARGSLSRSLHHTGSCHPLLLKTPRDSRLRESSSHSPSSRNPSTGRHHTSQGAPCRGLPWRSQALHLVRCGRTPDLDELPCGSGVDIPSQQLPVDLDRGHGWCAR
jgi:hypothetical protein